MTSNPRLIKILAKLAVDRAKELAYFGRNSAHLITASNPQTEADLKKLARILAEENILVLAAGIPPSMSAAAVVNIQTWINTYAGFYTLFANALFPGLNKDGLTAYYADGLQPPIVIVKGGATPVIEVIAGFVVPFVARGQMKVTPPEYEFRALVDVICDELDCNGLSMSDYQNLRRSALTMLQEMVRLPMRQISLTNFDRELFGDAPPPPEPPRSPSGLTPPGGMPPLVPPNGRPANPPPSSGQSNGYGTHNRGNSARSGSGSNGTGYQDNQPKGGTRPIPQVSSTNIQPSQPPSRSADEYQRYEMEFFSRDNAVAPDTQDMFQDSVGLAKNQPPEPRESEENREPKRRGGGRRTTRSLPVYDDLLDDSE